MDHISSLFVFGSFVVACSAKVDRLPKPGESLCADVFSVEPGGKGFNVAVGASRLGAKLDGIFAIGNDFFSQLAIEAFAQAGLPQAMLCRLEGQSGSGIGFIDAKGENCLAVYPGANRSLGAREVQAARAGITGAALVVAQFEIGDEPIRAGFTLAHAAGARTLLNPSPYRPIAPDILERTSILVLNAVEAQAVAADLQLAIEHYCPENLERLAAEVHARGPDLVVVTLGGRGAAAFERAGARHLQAAFPVEVVDTLGAGDAFTAGLATSLLEGRGIAESLRRAAACGAMVCRRIGVLGALPGASELALFLKSARTEPG